MPPRASTAAGNVRLQRPAKMLKHKRRYCRVPDCTRIVKSQGLCQRHGAKPRKCKVHGCEKQAQGNFDGMCKSHFKENKRQTTPLPPPSAAGPPPVPIGESVYDRILPESLAFSAVNDTDVMPLIQHLKAGFDANYPPAWHRNAERQARGLHPVSNPATQLEGWERELVWMEILVLTGNPDASFRHLARAWGRDKGFHMVLAQFICERHGDFERQRRTAGVVVTQKSRKSPVRMAPGKTTPLIGADPWDDACYGDVACNEALAAGIFELTSDPTFVSSHHSPRASGKGKRAPMQMNPQGDDILYATPV